MFVQAQWLPEGGGLTPAGPGTSPQAAHPPPPSALIFFSPARVTRVFVPLLKPLVPVALPPSLLGSALACGRSILELLVLGLWDRGSFWQLLTEGTPVTPPLSKPCHANQINQGIKNSSMFPRVITWCRLLIVMFILGLLVLFKFHTKNLAGLSTWKV